MLVSTIAGGGSKESPSEHPDPKGDREHELGLRAVRAPQALGQHETPRKRQGLHTLAWGGGKSAKDSGV